MDATPTNHGVAIGKSEQKYNLAVESGLVESGLKWPSMIPDARI